MPVNAAQLMVTVGANTAAAEQGIMGFARLLGPGGVLGLGAVGAAAAVAGIGIASVKMAGDFQSGMVSIVTGAGESQSNLKLISDGVLQMARDTGTSTKQLTEGLYMIESGGYRGATALNILRAAAEGAKVGNADLGTVADATDTVLKNYGNTGLTASQAVNVLIDTVKHGKTHMEDLAGALAHILPTAAAAGVSIQDVMGAMATMTGEGVDAANAATYLRQTMIALEAPTKASQQALAAVGLSAAQLNAGMRISLPDTIAMITNAIGRKFPVAAQAAQAEMAKVQNHTETFAQAVQHLSGQGGAMSGYMEAIRNISGGSRQMQGMLLLSSSHTATFKANADLLAKSAHTAGNTINGWALVQGTFNQHMSVLGETVKTLMIQLGTKLLPVATQLADLFAHGLSNGVDMLTGKSKGLTTGFGGELLGAIKLVGGFFQQTLLPTLKQLGAFYTSTILPIQEKFASVLMTQVLPAILPVVKTILTQWLPPLERIMKDILPVLNPLLSLLGWIFQNVIGPGLNLTAQAVGAVLGGIADLVDGITKFVHNPSVESFVGIIKAASGANTNIMKTFQGVLGSGARQGARDNNALMGLIPHFASGGVMAQSGLALVGENGPELVRLPGGADIAPIGGYSSGGQMTIVVNLKADGKRLAQVVVPHIHTVIRNATGARM